MNLSIGAGDTLIITPGYLQITGTSIQNNGFINIGASNGLLIQGTTVTLNGSGSVSMNDPKAVFSSVNGQGTLIIQQGIIGQGSLGGQGLTINNQSTISASGGTLTVQPNSGSLSNAGMMSALEGSTLSLTAGGPITFNNTGGIVEALNSGTVLLGVNLSGGTLTTVGSGMITLTPPGSGSGLTNLTNTGTFNVPSGASLSWQGTINNNGTFELFGAIAPNGTVTLQGSGTVLMTNGTFNGVSANPLINQQLIHGGGTFSQVPLTNQATIQADNASTPLVIEGSTTTNTGTLEASNGATLEFETVVNNSGGKIEALNGSTVILTNNFNGSVNGGTLATSGTGVIESQDGVLDGTVNVPTNAGTFKVNNFNLYLQGTINNTGSMTLSGNSCIILNKPTTLTGSGKLTMASATCIDGGGMALTNKSTIQGAGNIGDSNPMPITNQGTITATSTSPLTIAPNATGFTNTGKLVANSGATLNIQNFFNNLAGGALTGGTYMATGVIGIPSAVVTNAANVTLTGPAAGIVETGTQINALSTLGANTNKGSLTLQKGQLLTTATNFSNAGKVLVASASGFGVNGSYTQTAGTTTVDGTLTAPTTLTVQGGSLLGQGTVASVVTSSATVTAGDSTSKAGKLTITGTYTQNSTGVLNIAIGGTQVGTKYSQLAVSNGASINGTLNIKRLNGFVPVIGAQFTILTGSAVTGQFATVNGLSINTGEHFQLTYSPTAVTLTVVTGP